MPHPRIVLQPADAETPDAVERALRGRFAAVRSELGLDLPYPADALAEAERVSAAPPAEGNDLTALPFYTVDPPGSTDLDQALHLERDGDGHRIRYAIADVPAFVALGAALDRATRERGQTVYLPDGRVPLHPAVLSEGAGSLLPGQVRPALVWDLQLDGSGEITSATVARATVRSVEQLDYETVQRSIDSADPDPRFVLLREVGERRIA
ncbi:MAG: RNB domain-containing ribonuclease, partial [Dermatophilaceae bacterium]